MSSPMQDACLPKKRPIRTPEKIAVLFAGLVILGFVGLFLLWKRHGDDRVEGIRLLRGEGRIGEPLKQAEQGPPPERFDENDRERAARYLAARRSAFRILQETPPPGGESVPAQTARLALAGEMRLAFTIELARIPMRPAEAERWTRLFYGPAGERPVLPEPLKDLDPEIRALTDPRVDAALHEADARTLEAVLREGRP